MIKDKKLLEKQRRTADVRSSVAASRTLGRFGEHLGGSPASGLGRVRRGDGERRGESMSSFAPFSRRGLYRINYRERATAIPKPRGRVRFHFHVEEPKRKQRGADR